MIRVPGRIRGPVRITPGKEHHRNPMAKKRFTGILVPTILISVALITLPAVFDYVPNHHRGIVTREDGSVRFVEPGLHLRIAGVHPRPVSYPLQNLTLEGTAALMTRDGVTLRGEFTATVRIAPTDLLNFHRQRGDRPVLAAIRQEVATSLEQAARSRTADLFFRPTPGAELWSDFASRIRRVGVSPLGLFLVPQDLETAYRIADRYREENLPEAARRLLETMEERFPRTPEVHIRLARLYESLGEITSAEEQYLEALYLDLTQQEAMGWIYEQYLRSGELGRLETILMASMEKADSSVQHYTWLASVHFARKDYQAAEEILRSGLDRFPDNPEILLNLSWVYLERNQFPEAVEILKVIVASGPGNYRAQAHLGIALAGLARYPEAIEKFLAAQQIGGPSVDLFNRIAGTYRNLGQNDRAVAYLRESLKMLPDQPEQRALLAELEAEIPAPAAP